MSDNLTKNAWYRHTIYLISVIILISFSLIHLIDCNSKIASPTIESGVMNISVYEITDEMSKWCMNPWVTFFMSKKIYRSRKIMVLFLNF